YRILPLEQAVQELYAPNADPPLTRDRRTLLAVTFDDGYHDNYTHAAALANELQVPLTIFLVPGYVDSGSRFWWYEGDYLASRAGVHSVTLEGRAYDLGRHTERQELAHIIYDRVCHAPSVGEREAFLAAMRAALAVPPSPAAEDDPWRPLHWAEVQEMEAAGWISFGAHTMHHPILSYLHEPDEIRREVDESRRALEGHLGHPVHAFAYPFGRVEHIGEGGYRAAQEAGFACAVTALPWFNTPQTPPHLLRRISIGKLHWLVLATEVAGIWPGIVGVRRAALRLLGL